MTTLRLAGAFWAAAAGVVMAAAQATAQSSPQANAPLDTVLVIGSTPLAGADLTLDQIAAPVQTATADDLDRAHALDLTAYMKRALGSVYVNDVQSNPLQPDINYRGYTASPLLVAIRSHGHFAEYVPISLILLALLELGGADRRALIGLAAALVIARIMVPFGMGRAAPNPFRAGGSLIQWLMILAASAYGLWLVCGR